jgi:hypothetical protein
MRLYDDEMWKSSEEETRGEVPLGKKPGPAGSAVAQRQRMERETMVVVRDMAVQYAQEARLIVVQRT